MMYKGLFQIAKYHRFDALWDCREGKINLDVLWKICDMLLIGINFMTFVAVVNFAVTKIKVISLTVCLWEIIIN